MRMIKAPTSLRIRAICQAPLKFSLGDTIAKLASCSSSIVLLVVVAEQAEFIGAARTFKKVTHIKGRQLDQARILFNCVPFQMGTSLNGKNWLPEEATSFLYEQFLIVWKVTFITLSDLPSMLLFLLRTCVTCVMCNTPMWETPYM